MSAIPPTQAEPLRAATVARVRPRLRVGLGYRREDVITGYLFLLVPMIILLVFVYAGMIFDFWISFQRWDVITTPQAHGIENYRYIFQKDPVFWTAIKNTLFYSVGVVPIQTVIGFLLALVVNQKIRGRKFFRTVFYFPSVTSPVAISLLFLFLFNDLGLLNYMFQQVGLPRVGWLTDPHVALKSIMGLNIWTTSGTYMIIFLAALQDVPRDLYEAGAIDGATGFTAVRRITIPLIRPAIFFVVATGIIGTLQIFDQAFILSGGTGSPDNSTMTAVLYIYNEAFNYGFYGVAAAASFVLFVVIMIATIIVRKVLEPEA